MYDPEIYRHQISEYYNPYVLDADIQAGEFNFSIVSWEHCVNLIESFQSHLEIYFKKAQC